MHSVTMRLVRATTDASGKAISIAYPECVFVTLGIQHAMRMCHIVIYGLPRSTIFFNIISQTAGFSKQKVVENKMFPFSPKFYLKHFSF